MPTGLSLLAETAARAGLRLDGRRQIITPHPGEAARMLDRSTAEVQIDRLGAVSDLMRGFGGVALLKGAHTLVSGSDRPPWVIDAGNPGMATAGMGDVFDRPARPVYGHSYRKWTPKKSRPWPPMCTLAPGTGRPATARGA